MLVDILGMSRCDGSVLQGFLGSLHIWNAVEMLHIPMIHSMKNCFR